jgi:ribosomal protein S17E
MIPSRRIREDQADARRDDRFEARKELLMILIQVHLKALPNEVAGAIRGLRDAAKAPR